MGAIERRFRLDTEENLAFRKELAEELLAFGHQISSPHGGIYWLKEDGTPWKEKPRECYTTARMIHVYGIGKMLGHEGSEALAKSALDGLLTGEIKDKEHGGWYVGVEADGTPQDGKLCYAHAFVMLAATSGILAGIEGAEELLEEAKKVYDRYFWQEEQGLSCDVWDTAFTTLDSYRGLNANMHSVEAFLAVADVTGEEEYRVRAGRIIDRVIEWAKNNRWRIPEHYSDAWVPQLDVNRDKPDDPFKPYGATPGHGLEWSRLILQWALSTYGDDAEKTAPYIEASEHLFGRAVADAWNADGDRGFVYTTDWEGEPVVHDRHWTLAEGIAAAATLKHVTGKEIYDACYAQFMRYMEEQVRDHQYGSWYHQMDRNNKVTGSVWPGKLDLYHALQAVLIPGYVPQLSIAKAVREKGAV